ncbi:hypothetical protein DVH05_027818 [Phytophthora capsici]|nr:hypothetical protein DVH05_027818 [Phytophthora capsici]
MCSLKNPRVAACHPVLNGVSNFRTSHAVATHIADIMSRNGTVVFTQMLESLKRFEDIVTGGGAPYVSQASV